MKKLMLIALILIVSTAGQSQSCLPMGIIFSSQAQIDNFQANHPNCTEIEGNVRIQDTNIPGSDRIVNLNGLNDLVSIWDSLMIYHNYRLENLSGLENLDSIGGSLKLIRNDTMFSLTGLENLKTIGGSFVLGSYHYWTGTDGNIYLSSLSALENLTFIGGNFSIFGNHSLIDLAGLDSIATIEGDISIAGNDSLTSLTGLENLTKIDGDLILGVQLGGFSEGGNPSLANLSGLKNVTSVEGSVSIEHNYSLVDLTGLDSLVTIGGSLLVGANPSLFDLTGLYNLQSIGGGITIWNHENLSSLSGLENLQSTGEGLTIKENYNLTSLTALDNLVSIGSPSQTLRISENLALTSLSGLDNIDTASFNYLIITENHALTECEVKSICDHLADLQGTPGIHDNASGCNSIEEVIEACQVVFVEEYKGSDLEVQIQFYPNPFTTSATIKYELDQSELVKITFYNQFGKQVDVIVENQLTGLNKVVWRPENFPAGIYYFRMQSGTYITSGKVILVR